MGKKKGIVSAVKSAVKTFKRIRAQSLNPGDRAEMEEKFKALIKSREENLKSMERNSALNFAYLLGHANTEYDDASGTLKTRVRQVLHEQDSGSGSAGGTLHQLTQSLQVDVESENVLIKHFIKQITRTTERPFQFRVKSDPEVGAMEMVQAHRAELYLDIQQKNHNVNLARSRQIVQMNVGIDGQHYLLPVFDMFSGPERVVREVTSSNTPYPLVDKQGKPMLSEKDEALYAKEKDGKPEESTAPVGKHKLYHVSFRDVLPPPGYTYLDECPNVLFRMRIRVKDLEMYEETVEEGIDIEQLKDEIDGFYPKKYSKRDELVMGLFNDYAPASQSSEEEEDEHVEVYHYLEQRSKDYPEGLWKSFVFTSGKKNIVMLQEKSLPAHGRLGFPLIEVYAFKFPGRWQGMTLMEYSRGAQDRHNELLTQRVWNMKKAGNIIMYGDEESIQNMAQLSSVGMTVILSNSSVRGKPLSFQSPPQIPSELFVEDHQALDYLNDLWSDPSLPTREKKSATEIAIMAKGADQWTQAYGLISQAQAYAKVGMFFLQDFHDYAKYGQHLTFKNMFDQWETAFFMQSEIMPGLVEIDTESLTYEDTVVKQQKLQLWAQVDPEYFKTPQGREDAKRLLEVDKLLSSEQNQERRNAIAENYQVYAKGKLVQEPSVDEDDIIHLVEHLGSLSDPRIRNWGKKDRRNYTRHVLVHCLKHHVVRMEKFIKLGLDTPHYKEYVARVVVGCVMQGLIDDPTERKPKEVEEQTPHAAAQMPQGAVQAAPQDLLRMMQPPQAGGDAQQQKMLLAALLKSAAEGNQENRTEGNAPGQP